MTLRDLQFIIEKCRKQRPRVELLESVADVWTWIQEMEFSTKLSGLADSRAFELSQNPAGNVMLRAKPNMSDGDECYSTPLLLIPALPSPMPVLAYAIPRPVDIDGLSAMLVRLSSRLTESARFEWEQYLNDCKTRLDAMCPACSEFKIREGKVVIRQRDSKASQQEKRGLRNTLAAELQAHLQTSPTCISIVPSNTMFTLDPSHAPASPMKAPPPALPAHVPATAAAPGAQEFRMPLGMNGLLPTQPQLFIGTVPAGAKHRVELVNSGFMVAYSAPTTPMRFCVARVTGVTTAQVHALKYSQIASTFTESKEEVVLTAKDIIHWNFSLARKRKTLKVPDGQIKKPDLNIIQWDMRVQGMFPCLPGLGCVPVRSAFMRRAYLTCCCVDAATPALHKPAAQSAPTSAGTRPIIPTDSTPAPPPKSSIPAWLQTAKDDGDVNSCVPSEIVQERWLENTTGAQRQYLTLWHPSVVTTSKRRTDFKLVASSEDGRHHYGQYQESWERAEEFDRKYAELVNEWKLACGDSGVTTPLPPLSPLNTQKSHKRTVDVVVPELVTPGATSTSERGARAAKRARR